MSIEDLREKVYRIRTLLHLYEQSLSKSVSERESYAARNELKVTKDELLKLIVAARKKVNELAG